MTAAVVIRHELLAVQTNGLWPWWLANYRSPPTRGRQRRRPYAAGGLEEPSDAAQVCRIGWCRASARSEATDGDR